MEAVGRLRNEARRSTSHSPSRGNVARPLIDQGLLGGHDMTTSEGERSRAAGRFVLQDCEGTDAPPPSQW
jgi:hypothetical protein